MACNIEQVREILSKEFSGDALDLKVEEYKTMKMTEMQYEEQVDAQKDTQIEDEITAGVKVNRSIEGVKDPQVVSVTAVEKLGFNKYRVVHLTEKGKEGFTVVTRDGYQVGKEKSSYSKLMMDTMIAELGIDVTMDERAAEANTEYNNEYYKKQGAVLINDIESIKAFGDELRLRDNVQISDSHNRALDSVLDMFISKSKDFIPDMHVYLNDVADRNGGLTVFQGVEKGIYVNLASGMGQVAGNQISAKEAYVHELVHAVTEYAIQLNRADVANTMNRLRNLQEQVMSELKWEDFLPEHSSLSEAMEEKIARERLAYLQTKEGLSEFITYGLTNEQLRSKLEGTKVYREKEVATGFFEALLEMFKMLLETALQMKRKETKNTTGDQLLLKLSMQLAAANNNAMRAHKKSLMDVAADGIDVVNKSFSDLTLKFEKHLEDSPFPKLKANPTKFDRSIWTARNFWRLVGDKRVRPHMENVMSAMGMKQEGFVQTALRGFMKADGLQRKVERLELARGQIDQRREDMAATATHVIIKGFKEKPTKARDEALKLAVLDIDMASIFDDYEPKVLAAILDSKGGVSAEIRKLQAKLAEKVDDEGVLNYYKAQAEGLGRYMATNIASKAQLLNAENIARTLNAETVLEADPEIVELLDKLVTFEGLKYTKRDAKKQVAELLLNDEYGMRNIIGHHKAFKRESRENLFDAYSVNTIKGYMRETFNEDITIKVALESEARELAKLGYEISDRLPVSENDYTKGRRAIFVNRDKVVQSYNQGAMRLTDESRRGTTLTEVHNMGGGPLGMRRAEANIRHVNRQADKEIKAMFAGTYKMADKLDQLVPVMNEAGNTVDYRYIMNKDMKILRLDMETRGTEALGRSKASVLDKSETKDFNKEVLKVIRADMKQNYTGRQYGKNNKEYILISPNSVKKEQRELWKILPSELRYEVTESKEPIVVRRDLLYSYFGFRDLSLVNAPGLGAVDAKTLKHWIRLVEMAWQEIIKIVKVDIIIKMPVVLIGNVMSNLLAPIQLGMTPWAAIKLQMEGTRELTKYKQWHKERLELGLQSDAGMGKTGDAARMSMLDGWMETSSVKKLIDAGLFQAIIEDANMDDRKTSSKVTKKIDSLLEGAPTFVRNGANWLYLTERTSFFKAMTTMTQYSDFIARYSLYHGTMKKMAKVRNSIKNGDKTAGQYGGMKIDKNTTDAYLSEKTLQLVTDVFINYSIPSGKVVEYGNKMGLVMFTKYFERIQRVVQQGVINHPVNFLMAAIGQNMILDVSDISDQSLFVKDLGYIFHNPIEHVGTLLTPHSFALADDTYTWFTR